MSNRIKRPRLYLERARRRRDGTVREALWYVLDNVDGRQRKIPTGCAERETVRADRFLHDYLAEKLRPDRRRGVGIEEVPITDVLAIYIDDRPPELQRDKRFRGRMTRLNTWWGAKALAEVDGANCLAYAKARGHRGAARRELQDLKAAITYHRKLGLHREFVDVLLPQPGEPRTRYLARHEAARLVWTCWRATVFQMRFRGAELDDGIETDRRPLRHLARFILIGLYTGSRAGAIASASPIRQPGRAWVDLDNGLFYRRAIGRRANKTKPQLPAPIPDRLLAHLRRWHRLGIAKDYFVEWNGKPIKSVKTGFKSALKLAGLADEELSPHSLRHTAVTWALQGGATTFQAAGLVGMSEDMVRRVYGHHSPTFMREAAEAIQNNRGRLGRRPPVKALPPGAYRTGRYSP